MIGPAREVDGYLEGNPLNGRIISRYGRRAPVQRPDGSWTDWLHQAIDIADDDDDFPRAVHEKAQVHTAGFATTGGRVELVDTTEHHRRQIAVYEHLSEIHVERGQTVYRGDTIGRTGQSHLHFEVGGWSTRYDPLAELEWWDYVPDWMPNVERITTASQGGEIEPRGVMSHIMQGSQNTMLEWARSGNTAYPSAHFTIGRDGRIVQHVGIRTQAWHAGRLDPHAPPTWRLLPAGGNPNDYAVGIEHEGFSGDAWTGEMIDASIRVHRWLFDELHLEPSEDTVIGHYMTAPASRAHDPGPTWPRDRILKALTPVGSTAKPKQKHYETGCMYAYFGVLGWKLTVQGENKWLVEGPK